MNIQPIMPGLVAIEATGSSYTISQLVDTLDALPGWDIVSEITTSSSQSGHNDTITVLLWQRYDPIA